MDMQNAFQNLSWLAIIAGAVSAFVLGRFMVFSPAFRKEVDERDRDN